MKSPDSSVVTITKPELVTVAPSTSVVVHVVKYEVRAGPSICDVVVTRLPDSLVVTIIKPELVTVAPSTSVVQVVR